MIGWNWNNNRVGCNDSFSCIISIFLFFYSIPCFFGTHCSLFFKNLIQFVWSNVDISRCLAHCLWIVNYESFFKRSIYSIHPHLMNHCHVCMFNTRFSSVTYSFLICIIFKIKCLDGRGNCFHTLTSLKRRPLY